MMGQGPPGPPHMMGQHPHGPPHMMARGGHQKRGGFRHGPMGGFGGGFGRGGFGTGCPRGFRGGFGEFCNTMPPSQFMRETLLPPPLPPHVQQHRRWNRHHGRPCDGDDKTEKHLHKAVKKIQKKCNGAQKKYWKKCMKYGYSDHQHPMSQGCHGAAENDIYVSVWGYNARDINVKLTKDKLSIHAENSDVNESAHPGKQTQTFTWNIPSDGIDRENVKAKYYSPGWIHVSLPKMLEKENDVIVDDGDEDSRVVIVDDVLPAFEELRVEQE